MDAVEAWTRRLYIADPPGLRPLDHAHDPHTYRARDAMLEVMLHATVGLGGAEHRWPELDGDAAQRFLRPSSADYQLAGRLIPPPHCRAVVDAISRLDHAPLSCALFGALQEHWNDGQARRRGSVIAVGCTPEAAAAFFAPMDYDLDTMRTALLDWAAFHALAVTHGGILVG